MTGGSRRREDLPITYPESPQPAADGINVVLLVRACPRTANLRNFVGNFVGKLCRNRPFSTELRQSVSTKIDDKVGSESFGTSSKHAALRVLVQGSRRRC